MFFFYMQSQLDSSHGICEMATEKELQRGVTVVISGCVNKKRSSHPEVSLKKVLLEISHNSQENTCARVSFLIKLQAKACNFI